MSTVWVDKMWKKRNNAFYNKLHGPIFTFLSEPLQNSIIEYFYSVGLNPEIAMCVEYLSWNKEQRLYMAWLKNLYLFMLSDLEKSEQAQKMKIGGGPMDKSIWIRKLRHHLTTYSNSFLPSFLGDSVGWDSPSTFLYVGSNSSIILFGIP